MEEQFGTEDELIRTRIEKLEKLRQEGEDPFAVEKYVRSAQLLKSDAETVTFNPMSSDVIAAFESMEAAKTDAGEDKIEVSLAGRVVSFRLMGKAAFAHIEDVSGRIQIYLKKDELAESFENVKLIDLGDFIGVKGYVFRTRTGEVSVHAESFQMLAKCIRPIPFGKEKGDQHWYGLQDVEQRYRQRYLDLITNSDSREVFLKRSKIIKCVRNFYDSRGYMEVDTPVLQSIAGGAAARPFLTYHNALEHEFHLRISLELYLKRLIVGGLEKVYEIGRVFRNEGISNRHNPEFTLMESYEAYADLDQIMEIVEGLFQSAVKELYGGTTFDYLGTTIDVAGPWRRLPILQGIKEYAGVEPEAFDSLESALEAMEKLGLSIEQEHMVGGIIEKIHERFVQPKLMQPTFITDFPLETSPLAKKRQDDPRFVRRFEVYIATQETGNAFSEINDPIDQRERFEGQMKMRAAGDEEAHPMDEDFLRALEYGMPPTGGLGIGIDRMVMILCGQDNLKDVILFPQMKPEA